MKAKALIPPSFHQTKIHTVICAVCDLPKVCAWRDAELGPVCNHCWKPLAQADAALRRVPGLMRPPDNGGMDL